MKMYFILILIFLVSFSSKASNLSSWLQETPFGNMIEYSGNGTYSLFCENRSLENWRKTGVDNIGKWYFYKENIIGNYYSGNKINWFIFNEKTVEVATFINELEFKLKLEQHRLIPILWTRWYSSSWGYIVNSNTGLLNDLNQSFINIMLIVLTIYIVLSFFLTKFKLSRKINKVNILIVCILLLRIFLDVFPQSF